jgi:hypothetical protein
MGDGNINTNCDDVDIGWGEKLYGDIQGASAHVVGDLQGEFLFYIMFGSSKACKGDEELEDGEEGVSYMLVKGK